MRRIFLALALGAMVLPCPAKEAAKEAPKPKQFVDKSYVSLPKAVDSYILRSMEYDPNELAAGVQSNYVVLGAPERFTLSLYVFPQGQADEAKVVEAQLDGADAVIREQKDYSDIVALERRSLTLDVPAATMPGGRDRKIPMTFGQPVKVPLDEARKKEAGEKPIDEALRDMDSPKKATGRWQSYTFNIGETPVRSATVVFYRQLYNIKLRVTVPAASIDQAGFDALVEAAARKLVPKVDIRNLGQCGAPVMFAQDSGDKDLDAVATQRQIYRSFGRINRNNCSTNDDADPEPELAGYERKTIVFPEGTWQ